MGTETGPTGPADQAAQGSGVAPPWSARYIVVKALEDGVIIMGLTRGVDTRSHHSERLDRGEVLVAQFTQMTAAIKVRGRAEILTDVGPMESGA
jgi:transcription attenuation protein (tryptophan RNA-binding attenuator protein)